MSIILYITERAKWEEAMEVGRYEADSFSAQGFINCPKPDQVISVANFLFRGRNDLILLCIDINKVAPEICYENCEGGKELFPHVYGPGRQQ